MAVHKTLEEALQSFIETTEQSNQQIKAALADLAEQSKQTEQQIKLTELKLAALAEQSQAEFKQSRQEMDRQVSRLNKQMGELSAKMGTLVEDMVSPDMLRILRQVAHIPEEELGWVNVRVKRPYRGHGSNGHAQMVELDAIAECGDYVLINETKNTFRPEYVTDFLKRLAVLRDYFPEFKDRQVYAAISSLRIEPSVALHANRQGLLVLSLAEGMLQFQNEPGFQPKLF